MHVCVCVFTEKDVVLPLLLLDILFTLVPNWLNLISFFSASFSLCCLIIGLLQFVGLEMGFIFMCKISWMCLFALYKRKLAHITFDCFLFYFRFCLTGLPPAASTVM